MTTKGLRLINKIPCDKCGKVIYNHNEDGVYDVIFYKRNFGNYKRSKTVSKFTLNHLRLCRDCAKEFSEFLDIYKEGYWE